jgi:hypothetical protein
MKAGPLQPLHPRALSCAVRRDVVRLEAGVAGIFPFGHLTLQ